jgi:hypothetical protein
MKLEKDKDHFQYKNQAPEELNRKLKHWEDLELWTRKARDLTEFDEILVKTKEVQELWKENRGILNWAVDWKEAKSGKQWILVSKRPLNEQNNKEEINETTDNDHSADDEKSLDNEHKTVDKKKNR